jgi:hypothetical protein
MRKMTLMQKLRRFIITNDTAYRIAAFLHIKKIKNFLEKFNIFIAVDKKAREHYATKHVCARERLDEFIFYIIDNCDLNCKNCSSFCPIATVKYISVEKFTQDLQRIFDITGGDIDRINLSGGEPLMHPDLLKLLEISRKIFPKTSFRIGTNGILLSQKKDDFWQAVKDSNFSFIITRYPIKLNWKPINYYSDKFDVLIEYQGLEIGKKTTHHFGLDLTGSCDAEKNFKRCGMANACLTFKHSKFYTCSAPAMIDIFNAYFNKTLGDGQENGIDVYKHSLGEILEFLARPIPFCKYCDMDHWTYNHEWGISKKDIKEWTF